MVTPMIRATFKLNEKGEPEFIQRDNRKNYRIRLNMENPPADTYAVTYILLHETFYDPVLESRDRESGFAKEFTSYGNFTLQAKIRTRDRVETAAILLSAALESSYTDNRTPQIEAALRDIRSN
jgi:hypothetical protein